MTYTSREESNFLGEPVEIYDFKYGTKTFHFTSADHDVKVGILDYISVVMKRGKIERNQDIGRTPLNIVMSRSVELTDLFIDSPPTTQVELTIKRFHEGESENVIVLWVGRMVNIKYQEDTAELRCESIHTSLKRPALRRFYQISCPHVLYGLDCRAVTTDFESKVNIIGITGLTITIPNLGKPDGYFSGGYISYSGGPASNLRFITSHTGNEITISLPARELAAGAEILLYPGCDHVLGTCVNKFNNVVNYGGFPFVPQKNPFGSGPVF